MFKKLLALVHHCPIECSEVTLAAHIAAAIEKTKRDLYLAAAAERQAKMTAAKAKAKAKAKADAEAAKLASQQSDLVYGTGRWKLLGQKEHEEKLAKEKARRDGEELVMIPEAEF